MVGLLLSFHHRCGEGPVQKTTLLVKRNRCEMIQYWNIKASDHKEEAALFRTTEHGAFD